MGLHLMRTQEAPSRIHMLIGHTHWDHIQGFPFFTPAFLPSTELNIYAPAGFQRSLEDSLSGQMQYSYFPVKLTELSSRIHYTELEEGFFRIGDVLVETQYLNHTAPTIGYRIASGGAAIAYITDHEPFWDSPGPVFHHPGDQRHIAFLRGADLVIHDAQYSKEEYRNKRGWGHSTVDYATDVAAAADVRRLALFHHDPNHDDAKVRSMENYSRARAAAMGARLEVFAAAEGMELEVIGHGVTATVSAESALDRRPVKGGRIMVVTGSRADATLIEQSLAEDHLIVAFMADGRMAVDQVKAFTPDLVILNSTLADGHGASFIRPLRSALGKPELPILILTGADSTEALYSAESIATDYLAQPLSPPMLRSRVRVWLARTMGPILDGVTIPEEPAPARAAAAAAPPPSSDPADIRTSASLFRSLTPYQFERLLRRSVQVMHPAGHQVIRQGEFGRQVHVILSGRVRIVAPVHDSSVEMLLCELGQGEVFGEIGILQARPRSATVITVEPATCLVIPEEDFMEALAASPEMSVTLLRILAGRLYEADRRLARYAPDPLTGLPGRRAFYDLYRRLASGARRQRSGILLIVVDIVHLRSINDRYGYAAGDDVLRTVADALLESSRGTDLVARYGSDEFAALMVDAGVKDLATITDRIRNRVRHLAAQRGLPLSIDCRIGYAVSESVPDAVDDLLRAADRDMQGKTSGTRLNS